MHNGGQGIGVGGGELLSHLKKVQLGQGPLKKFRESH